MATSIVEGLPLIAGAFTPTEIYQTWEAGATAVHLFPAHVLGPRVPDHDCYHSLPDIPIIPTTRSTLDTMMDWLKAGATAVCIDDDFLQEDNHNTTQAIALALAKVATWRDRQQTPAPLEHDPGTGEFAGRISLRLYQQL